MRFTKSTVSVVLVLFSLFIFLTSVTAAPGASKLLTFNGQLNDDQGAPVTGERTMTFRIYDSVNATPSQSLWSSGDIAVTVSNGYFSAILGTSPQPEFPEGLFADDTRYIGVTVEGEELVPRKRLTSVPSALNADAGVPSGFIGLWFSTIDTIPNGWVICDGSNNTPNLINNFVVGAGGSYAFGAWGGTATNNLAHSHTVGNHAHHVDISIGSSSCIGDCEDGCDDGSKEVGSDDHGHRIIGDTWGAAPGTTSNLSSAVENRPPYIALFFIMKL